MKIDLHVHLRLHHRIDDIRRAIKARGLDGIAVTNFHNVSFAQYVRERIEDALIIIGQEVDSQAGHILAIHLEEKIPDLLTPEETIRRIHGQGGLAILPHPYLGWNSILPHGRMRELPFDAVEIFNYRCGPLLWPNFFAKAGLRGLPWPRVANTDSKELATIGLCYNEVPVAPAERYPQCLAQKMIPEILDCLRQGKLRRHETWDMPDWAWFQANLARMFLPQKFYKCFHCGDKIVFHFFSRSQVCLLCGRQEVRHTCCVRGHFMCNSCSTRKAFETLEFRAYREKLESKSHEESLRY